MANLNQVFARGVLISSLTLFLLILGGCTSSLQVKPDVTPSTTAFLKLEAVVDYDGNRLYLPKSILAVSTSAADISCRYQYDINYGNEDYSKAMLFNPVTLLGVPTGTDQITATAVLAFRKGNTVLKQYQSAAQISKNRNLFQHTTLTELRRELLFAMRDNIDAQIAVDKHFFSNLGVLRQ